MRKQSTLSRKQAKKFYDRYGSKQDSQAYYEDGALERLVKYGDFSSADAVFEFGCGTGRFAKKLLEEYLHENATYFGCDISSTMIGFTSERLSKYADRARVQLIEEFSDLALQDQSYDRFVSNYVFDLLSFSEITSVLNEARRLLKTDGLLCLSGITSGCTPFSRIVMGSWNIIHKIQPALLGGCRPVDLMNLIGRHSWQIAHDSKISAFGISSEVVVARKKG
jgi:ubiquinone/menaquinone biosynthesis C-methylase UbiE